MEVTKNKISRRDSASGRKWHRAAISLLRARMEEADEVKDT